MFFSLGEEKKAIPVEIAIFNVSKWSVSIRQAKSTVSSAVGKSPSSPFLLPKIQSTCSWGRRMGNNFDTCKTLLTNPRTTQHSVVVLFLRIENQKPQLFYLHVVIKKHIVTKTSPLIRALSQ